MAAAIPPAGLVGSTPIPDSAVIPTVSSIQEAIIRDTFRPEIVDPTVLAIAAAITTASAAEAAASRGCEIWHRIKNIKYERDEDSHIFKQRPMTMADHRMMADLWLEYANIFQMNIDSEPFTDPKTKQSDIKDRCKRVIGMYQNASSGYHVCSMLDKENDVLLIMANYCLHWGVYSKAIMYLEQMAKYYSRKYYTDRDADDLTLKLYNCYLKAGLCRIIEVKKKYKDSIHDIKIMLSQYILESSIFSGSRHMLYLKSVVAAAEYGDVGLIQSERVSDPQLIPIMDIICKRIIEENKRWNGYVGSLLMF